jgi:hypothetical protein
MTIEQIRDCFNDLESKGYALTSHGWEHPDHPKPIFVDYMNILSNKSDLKNKNNMINIQDLKIGQIVWECQSGRNARLLVKGSPFEAEGGWKCLVEASNGEFELFSHNKYPGYAPRLYDEPVYKTISDIEEFNKSDK